jgi:hypothetical protein
MTAKPAVPPELAELIGLLAKLTKVLPAPASRDGAPFVRSEDWEQRDETEDRRQMVLRSCVISLNLAVAYPGVAPDLAELCARLSARVRDELATPLGYQPDVEEPGPGHTDPARCGRLRCTGTWPECGHSYLLPAERYAEPEDCQRDGAS